MLLAKWQEKELQEPCSLNWPLLFCFPVYSSLLFVKLLDWRLCELTLASPPPQQVSRLWMRNGIFCLFVCLKNCLAFWGQTTGGREVSVASFSVWMATATWKAAAHCWETVQHSCGLFATAHLCYLPSVHRILVNCWLESCVRVFNHLFK